MKKIRIGGVPEHFNMPWHLCLEEGLFKNAGLDVEWRDYPGGTGAMTRELRHDGVDVAIVLTEGMVADIALGNRSRIVSFYTATPLNWGVHTTAYNRFEVLKDVDPMIFAISRWGSGSHLMAYVYAEKLGLDPNRDISFKIVGDLKGARESLADKTSNLFLWEKFTTKPFVDKGELKILDTVPTPWPCFVIAARDEFIESRTEELDVLVRTILDRANRFKSDKGTPEAVAARYDQKVADVQQWLANTEWVGNPGEKFESLQQVIETLHNLGIIKSEPSLSDVCIDLKAR